MGGGSGFTSPIMGAGTGRDRRPHPSSAAHLRWITSAFDSAQALRLKTGDQLRATLRERPVAVPLALDHAFADRADALLARIRAGETAGADPTLAAAYQRYWHDEREMLGLLTSQVAEHPTWSWLSRVDGVSAPLAGRLLARLDAERAPTPSSFWSYCGLATVEGTVHRCDVCGYELIAPAGRRIRAAHRVPRSTTACTGSLIAMPGSAPVRVAQPRPTHGESARYDRQAKKLCYLIGVSFVRQGGSYRRYYEEQCQRLDQTKGDWIVRRRHLTALRMTEKLFLAHLWLVWREAIGLPITTPSAQSRLHGGDVIAPWSMVDR